MSQAVQVTLGWHTKVCVFKNSGGVELVNEDLLQKEIIFKT